MARLNPFRRVASNGGKTPQGKPGSALPPPGPMTNVVALVVDATTVRLTDDLPATPYALRGIRRTRDDPSGNPQVFEDAPSVRVRDFSGLVSGATYTFTTAPVDVGGVVGPVVSVQKTPNASGGVGATVPDAPSLRITVA